MARKFFKTTYTVVVLSARTPAAGMGLDDLNDAITDGDCSGDVTDDGGIEVTPQEMAALLLSQGSDPEFLQLDEQGNDLDDEGDGDAEQRYTAAEIVDLPTLSVGQVDNLKIDTGTKRVWLCRSGIEDGMPHDNLITVEHLIDGKWTTVAEYPGGPTENEEDA